MNNSNESDKLWNILLTNLTLEHNNKNNKQNIKGVNEYMNETYKVIPDLQKSLQIENQKRKSLEDIISQLKDKIGKLEKKKFRI